MTIQKAGTYVITATMAWKVTSSEAVIGYICINGSPIIPGNPIVLAPSGIMYSGSTTIIKRLNANDQISFRMTSPTVDSVTVYTDSKCLVTYMVGG